MNTKFFFVLPVIVIALIATACTPIIVDSSAPLAQSVQPANNTASDLVPVTGESVSKSGRATQEPRLWSGEIYLSDDGNPDQLQNAVPAAEEKQPEVCTSEDSQPRRQSGCVE